MKKLAEAVQIGGLSLKNRTVRSATLEMGCLEDGRLNDKLGQVYADLARGGVAAIITGMMGVDENSRAYGGMADTREESFVPALRKIIEPVHKQGCKLIVQIAHCGIKAGIFSGTGPLGPSALPLPDGKSSVAMSADEIKRLAASFAEAALRCKEAGADGVELHAAHGYLLSQFLSPFLNQRTDEYGGGIEGRSRALFEVYRAARAAVGPDYPIWVKINCKDLVEPSTTPEEFAWVCEKLATEGIDAIEVSGGLGMSLESAPMQVIKKPEQEGTFAPEALAVAARVSAPVISVGGFRSPDKIEEWLNKGNIAAVALSRPLMSDPDLPGRWQKGERAKARCISCNKCFRPTKGFGCQVF